MTQTTKNNTFVQITLTGNDAVELSRCADVRLFDRLRNVHTTDLATCLQIVKDRPADLSVTVYVQATLTAEETSYGWAVTDSEGGVWWPQDHSVDVIEAAADPESVALALCTLEPCDAGEWVD